MVRINFPEAAESWHEFYSEYYFGGKISDERWPLMRAYEQTLREELLPHCGDDPDMEYVHFMEEAMVKAGVHTQKETVKEAVNKAREEAMKLLTKHRSKSSSHNRGRSPAHESPKPFHEGQDRQGSRGKAQKSREDASRKCFACGGFGHWASDCHASAQVNGRELTIKRDGRNWVLADGKGSFCYNYNTERRCKNHPCNRGIHICTLCSDSGHRAYVCSATA